MCEVETNTNVVVAENVGIQAQEEPATQIAAETQTVEKEVKVGELNDKSADQKRRRRSRQRQRKSDGKAGDKPAPAKAQGGAKGGERQKQGGKPADK